MRLLCAVCRSDATMHDADGRCQVVVEAVAAPAAPAEDPDALTWWELLPFEGPVFGVCLLGGPYLSYWLYSHEGSVPAGAFLALWAYSAATFGRGVVARDIAIVRKSFRDFWTGAIVLLGAAVLHQYAVGIP